MIRTGANYNTYNALAQKKPVMALEFYNLTPVLTTGTFSGITSDYKKLIKSVEVVPCKIDFLKSETQFYGFDIVVADDSSNTFLNLLSTNALSNIVCTVKAGFQEIAITDFFSYPNCRLKNVEINSEKKEYTLSMRSVLYDMNKPIIRRMGQTILTADASAADLTLEVTSTAAFTAFGAAPWGAGSSTYLMVGNEIMEYTGTDADTFTVTRGCFTSENTTHKAGEGVWEVIYYYSLLNGYDMILEILTTTAAGTNGNWDIGLADFGLGIDVDEIDVNQIYNEFGRKWQSALYTDFSKIIDPWKEKSVTLGKSKRGGMGGPGGGWIKTKGGATGTASIDNGLDWLQNNVLSELQACFIFTDNGKLGIKTLDVIGQNEGIDDIDQDSIIGVPSIDEDDGQLITKIEINSKTNGDQTGKYLSIYAETNTTGVTSYGNAEQITINTNNTNEVSSLYRAYAAYRIFGFYGNPHIKLKFKMFWPAILYQAGDILNFSHDKLINIRDNSIGWTNEPILLTSVKPEFEGGSRAYVAIEAINMSMIEKADISDIHVFEQADINDYVLTVDADHAEATLQAADAYLTNTVYSCTMVMVRIELVQPGVGGGDTTGYITLEMRVQDPANTDLGNRTINIYYDETSSETIYADCYITDIGGVVNPDRVRVDWYATGGANAPSSVKIHLIKFWNYKGTVTEV